MSLFFPEPAFRHGTAPTTAVILINLGTPESPTPGALKRYLKEFLSDPRVVELPRALWWLILNGIILNTRPRKSAAKYASIWTTAGSPLKVHADQQVAGIQTRFDQAGLAVKVVGAMRYGHPNIPEVIQALKAEGAQRILLAPMYPQYSASTTATAFDAAYGYLMRTRNQPEIRTLRHFHDDKGYLAALRNRVLAHWENCGRLGKADHLVISFHGLPRRSLDLGDPYYCECLKTGRLLAESLELDTTQYTISFQSRFGKEAWLQPYTTATLHELAARGCKRVDIICPGFTCDCLETLEEIAQEGREDFLAAGGESYHYIPALNDDPSWLDGLFELLTTHLGGWPMKAPPECELAKTALLAKNKGANH